MSVYIHLLRSGWTTKIDMLDKVVPSSKYGPTFKWKINDIFKIFRLISSYLNYEPIHTVLRYVSIDL